MFNLLPQKEKQKIVKGYFIRRNIILLIFIFALGIISSISLFPSFLLSRVKIKETEESIKVIQNSPTFKEAKLLNDSLLITNMKIDALTNGLNNFFVGDILTKVIEKRGEDVRITSIAFKKGLGKDLSQIFVNGIARDRESLSYFVEELKKDKLFEKVNLPVSNFAKDSNAEFSVQISGTF